MADYGVKAAQKNFNLLTCADYQLLFNSSWPILKILDQGAFSIADTTLDVTIATHNKGFIPLWLVFDTSGYVDADNAGASQLANTGVTQFLTMSGVDLKWSGATRGATAGSFSGYYYIYEFDLQTIFDAPNTQTIGQSAVAVNDFGLKIAKAGSTIFDPDLRNFIVHSGTRSPQIHRSNFGNFSVIGSSTIATHNLGYPPLFFVFAKVDGFGDDRWQSLMSADDSFVIADNTTIEFGMIPTGDWAYIVFKDPFSLD